MKNITLSLPDDVYEKAAHAAAERDTSVDALVAGLLFELPLNHSRDGASIAPIDAAFDAIENFSASGRLTRDQMHDRSFTRELHRRQLPTETASPP